MANERPASLQAASHTPSTEPGDDAAGPVPAHASADEVGAYLAELSDSAAGLADAHGFVLCADLLRLTSALAARGPDPQNGR